MGKFGIALLWLGAPFALMMTGILPWWGAVAWILSPAMAVVLLGVGAGTIAWVMDTCTGSRAVRGQAANFPQTSLTVKLSKPASSSIPPSAWTMHRPGSP
jgi:hypothetical protein